MSEYVFGANILENLTAGMYKDAQVIFREYIQNSCDAIDEAMSPKFGILRENEGEIKIFTYPKRRLIVIEDNGTGITAAKFRPVLTAIAQSEKNIDSEKGFRGIGRFCGAAYCNKVRFTATAKGENVTSIMTIDARSMYRRFYDSEVRYTAQELLDDVITFEQIPAESDKHGFKVELIDVNEENFSLLDARQVRKYLSMVAPVPYAAEFNERKKIYSHAAELGIKLDEYKIFINDELLFKPYGTNYRAGRDKSKDEIFDFDFRDFTDEFGNFIAWGWVGLSEFSGVIKPNEITRSIRLRKHNIQIGDETTLQKLFEEDRGIHYFVGEIFAYDKNLIPNSRRDDFVENSAKEKFKKVLKKYFKELHKVYRTASNINSAKNKIDKYVAAIASFEYKLKNHLFRGYAQREEEREKLNQLAKQAEIAVRKIERQNKEASVNPETPLSKVTKKLAGDNVETSELASIPADFFEEEDTDSFFRAQNLSSLDEKEQKLVQQIYNIIYDSTDVATYEKIINKIEEALK